MRLGIRSNEEFPCRRCERGDTHRNQCQGPRRSGGTCRISVGPGALSRSIRKHSDVEVGGRGSADSHFTQRAVWVWSTRRLDRDSLYRADGRMIIHHGLLISSRRRPGRFPGGVTIANAVTQAGGTGTVDTHTNTLDAERPLRSAGSSALTGERQPERRANAVGTAAKVTRARRVLGRAERSGRQTVPAGRQRSLAPRRGRCPRAQTVQQDRN